MATPTPLHPLPQTYYQLWQLEKFGNIIENVETHHMQDDFENGFNEQELIRIYSEIQLEAILN